MNTLFAITLLALVACTYGAPTSDLTSALINQLDDDELANLINGQAQEDGDDDLAFLMTMMQDDDDEEGIAQLEAVMRDARYQKWFKTVGRKLKSFGNKVYNGVKKVGQKVYNGAKKVVSNPIAKGLLKHAINKISPIPIPIKAKSENDDDYEDSMAELEAMLQNAKIEGWKKSFRSFGKKAVGGIKKVASNPTVKKLGRELLNHYLGPEQAEAEDDDIALMLATMQDDDEDGIAELEAILQNF